MKRLYVLLIFLILPVAAHSAQDEILKIVIEGDINPVSAKFIVDNITKAETENFQCLIIQMDTPGGLLESTKTIVKKILSAQVPVVMYIAPSGSGAVSAGTFITLACNVAAMAEGTNIGAAHPVGVGGKQDTSQVMGEKVTNYASTWIRGIAEKRGRNADWAEKAVRESVSINEKEALEINVIDMICPTESDLIKQLDGRKIELEGNEKVLDTANAKIVLVDMSWRTQILYKISNPTIAYILLMLGIYGLFFEFSNPGSVIPGVAGGIFIILAFFALQTLPVRGAGLLLILFAIILFILEVKVTSYGVLTIGGIVAMFLGSIMLFEETPGFPIQVDWKVAIAVTLVTGLFIVFALSMAVKTRLTKPTTGREGLIGEIGTAITKIDKDGQVQIHGEIWKAFSDEAIKKGDDVQITRVDGLVIKVRKC